MITLGCDPGVYIGWAILDVDKRGTARWIDGGTYSQPEEVDELLCTFVLAVELVVVEVGQTIYGRAGFGTRMAGHLARMSLVAGQILGFTTARGIRTSEVSAAEWRKALCGRHNATDTMVKQMARIRVRNLPKRTSVHCRDAAGCAIYGAMRSGNEELFHGRREK